jgi:hypothetical protein
MKKLNRSSKYNSKYSVQVESQADYIQLQKDSLRLGNKSLALSLEESVRSNHKIDCSIIDMRIENARRNVQLLGSFCMQFVEKGSPDSLKDFNKEAMEVLLLNLKILKETETIK